MRIKKQKLLSLMFAAVMVFALFAGFPASAFADSTIDATVVVEFYGADPTEWPTTVNVPFDINSTYEWHDTLPPDNYYNEHVVFPADRPSVLDASWQAFEEMGIAGDEFIWGWDKKPHADGTVEWRGVWVDGMFDMVTADSGNSYLPTPGHDGYWEGDAWLYEVRDADGNVVVPADPTMTSGLYASNVELTDGMTITWNYTTLSFYYPYED
ncbi:hypothetical protein ABDB91_15840 [Desulfoscipio sp. XC116]|uniref:hypothetical protein n=1 Tax=Desulfoscipio sp. XC116 TaxID=3144975 RepID=UPI00325B5556